MFWRWIIALCMLGCTEDSTSLIISADLEYLTEGVADSEFVLDQRPIDMVISKMNLTDGGVTDGGGLDGGGLDGGGLDGIIPTELPNCEAIEHNPSWDVCDVISDGCTAVFEDGAGCTAVCAAVDMRCVESFENIEGECAADRARPALGCEEGHNSDFCVCQRGECVPECEGRLCGSDGCGDLCGTCSGENRCIDGACIEPSEVLCSPDDCPSFLGAEGEGRNARGGRGGDVCRVTRLNDSGAGSLRHCLSTGSGPRTVVFSVAGYIDLTSTIRVQRSNITIAGQTAPGDGITVRDWGVVIEGDHIIIQHIRFRAGDREKATRNSDGFTEDSLSVTGDDVMIDHVSVSWGIDENLSCGPGPFRRVTVQHSIISEGLHRTRLFHGEYDEDHSGHSMGGLYKSRSGDSTISIHHNLFAHNNNRNPAIGNYDAQDSFDADIRNNVIYSCRNMGYVSGASRRVRVNYVSNYGIFGPASRSDDLFRGNEDSNVKIFQRGNLIDVNRNRRFDGVDRGWSMFGYDYDRMDEAVQLQPVTTHTADEALDLVLSQAGARPWSRDRVDLRIVRDVENGTGDLIDSQSDVDGWGELNGGEVLIDSDQDGMPDDWERAHGSDPARADHNNDADGNGYSNLEDYLYWAARFPR